MLQHREVLGDLYRVVRGDQRGGGGEDDPLGLCRDVGQRGGGGGREERPVVVLADGVDIHADFLDLFRDRHRGLDPLLLRGRAAGGGVRSDVADAEYADLHDCSFAEDPAKGSDLYAFASNVSDNRAWSAFVPSVGGPTPASLRD